MRERSADGTERTHVERFLPGDGGAACGKAAPLACACCTAGALMLGGEKEVELLAANAPYLAAPLDVPGRRRCPWSVLSRPHSCTLRCSCESRWLRSACIAFSLPTQLLPGSLRQLSALPAGPLDLAPLSSQHANVARMKLKSLEGPKFRSLPFSPSTSSSLFPTFRGFPLDFR